MGEFERIARLAKRFPRAPAGVVGIGDDCALLPAGGERMAVTVDCAVDGVHFARELLALDQAAERAVEAALSDLAAMGATVRADVAGGAGILCALTAPKELSEPDFDAVIEGIARAAERAGAVVLGGNLARAPVLSITTTALGRVEGRALLREGARVGERVFVTGAPGAAALGLRALRAGRGDEAGFAPFVRAWRAPRARLAEGVAIARFASAAIDVSDGLAQDAGHLARASGCALVLDASALPMLDGQREAAAALGADATELALHGGEDYELLFTAAGEHGAGWTAIGEVVAGDGVHLRDARGVRAIAPGGWDHFR